MVVGARLSAGFTFVTILLGGESDSDGARFIKVSSMQRNGLVKVIPECDVVEGDGGCAAWCRSGCGFAGSTSKEKAYNRYVTECDVDGIVRERV